MEPRPPTRRSRRSTAPITPEAGAAVVLLPAGADAVGVAGADAVGVVNNHTAVGADENGGPHGTGHDVGAAHKNKSRKVDDTVTGGTPVTRRCHETDGNNKASSTTPSTTVNPETHSVSAERDKTEASGRTGDTPKLASKYATKKANGDIGAASMGHMTSEVPRPMRVGARLARMTDPVTSKETRMTIKRNTRPRHGLGARIMTLPTRMWPEPEWVMV